jgi:hypothetical protein
MVSQESCGFQPGRRETAALSFGAVDGTLAYEFTGTGVQAMLPISKGTHSVVVQAWNKAGATYKKAITVNVVPVPITITTPAANATVTSPVTVAASAPANSPVRVMQLYIDGALVGRASGQSIKKSVSLLPGKHHIIVKGWDLSANSWYTGEYVKVP